MTVIRPNSVAGINSITVASGEALSVHKSDGTLISTIVSSTGVGTFHSIEVGTAATISNNGNATFSGIVTATSFVGGLPITSGADNRVITASSSSAIQGESNLTFDGGALSQTIDANDEGINITSSGAHSARLKVDTNQSSADDTIFFQSARWNNTEVASIHFRAGADTTNKDDGRLTFHTRPSGSSMAERLRIDESGRIGIQGAATKGVLDVRASGGSATMLTAVFGANEGQTGGSLSDNADKACRVGSYHYDIDEEPFGIFVASGSNGTNNLTFGGGTSLMNAATTLSLYTAANSTTTNGTKRLEVASDGNIHINTTDNGTANAKLNIEDSSSVGVNVLKLINKPSSSNGKARLELYAETSGGQGATAYIQSISGTDADGSNSANDAGLEFHTSQGGSGTDVTALKIDNSGKTRISTHEGNDALHITPLASASTSIVINTWPDNANGRNWAIRNRYNEHGRLEFMRGTSNSDSPLTPVFVLNRDSSCSFSGALSKASGSFKIDHPLPSKTNTHHLVHSFIEGPQADLIYRGKVDLVGGTSTVNIDTVAGMSDGTFVLLNREVQCFTSNETGWTAVKGSVSGNVLTITAQDNSCTDTISWMVVGERKDPHMYDTEWTDADGKVILEPLKETEVSLGGG